MMTDDVVVKICYKESEGAARGSTYSLSYQCSSVETFASRQAYMKLATSTHKKMRAFFLLHSPAERIHTRTLMKYPPTHPQSWGQQWPIDAIRTKSAKNSCVWVCRFIIHKGAPTVNNTRTQSRLQVDKLSTRSKRGRTHDRSVCTA